MACRCFAVSTASYSFPTRSRFLSLTLMPELNCVSVDRYTDYDFAFDFLTRQCSHEPLKHKYLRAVVTDPQSKVALIDHDKNLCVYAFFDHMFAITCGTQTVEVNYIFFISCDIYEIINIYLYLQIEITLKDSTDEGELIKHFLHTKGKEFIRDKLRKYVAALKEGEFIAIM